MELFIKVFPALMTGLKTTLQLFGATLVLSLPLGILIGLVASSRIKPLRWLISLYIWVIRGTPLLLQMFFIFYGLPFISESLVLPRFTAALIAFVVNYAAYFAEIFRGGIQGIPQGQYEAAQVLGLSKGQVIKKIVIPQVFKLILPSVGNEVVTLVKDTSLIYAVGLSDVMRAGKVALQVEVSVLPLVEVAIFYLILTGIVTLVLRYIESRFNYYQ